MSRSIRYVIGIAGILAALFVIFFRPPDISFYIRAEHMEFLKRGFFVLILCSVLCLYRIVRGPTAADRIVAIDMFGIVVIGFCALLSIGTARSWYIDIAIAWALQSFISTLALAKFLEGKDFDD